MVSRLSIEGGCEVPDDEVCVIVGTLIAKTLQVEGIRNRKNLAACDSEFIANVCVTDIGFVSSWIHIGQ